MNAAFNLNTVSGYDGRLRTGIGGGPDAAAGASLTVVALPLVRVSRGRSAPSVRDHVHTVVTPGEVVDVVVTEAGVSLNPASRSPWLDGVREGAACEGLELLSIEAQVDAARRAALDVAPIMDPPRPTDQVVFAVEWRDGRVLDVVYALEEPPRR